MTVTGMTEAIIMPITGNRKKDTTRGTMIPVTGGANTGTGATAGMAGLIAGMVADTTARACTPAVSRILGNHCQCVPAQRHAGTHPTRFPAPSGVQKRTENTTAAVPSKQQENLKMETFLAANEDKAFYVAYAALWDRETALDVVQESMTRLVEYYRDKPPEEWPALFRTILKSRINDVRRRRLIEQGKHRLVSLTGLFRSQHDEHGDSREYELPDGERDDGITGPEGEYVAGELRSRVVDALQSLSERQRQVFILREWRGMSISETATTLGCSENSVKQHHFRAMQALRKLLAEVWEHAQPTAS
jgi:RNA polymerase sigma-70 factor (ECF subfamily)